MIRLLILAMIVSITSCKKKKQDPAEEQAKVPASTVTPPKTALREVALKFKAFYSASSGSGEMILYKLAKNNTHVYQVSTKLNADTVRLNFPNEFNPEIKIYNSDTIKVTLELISTQNKSQWNVFAHTQVKVSFSETKTVLNAKETLSPYNGSCTTSYNFIVP